MKKLQLLTLLFLTLGFTLQAQTTVIIDPNTRHQEIEGWGTSLCWWANKVGKWTNESKIDEMIDFITSPDGMNMNVFRYNIGGGDNPDHVSTPGNPGHMAHGKGERCEMEGFWPSEDAEFDWTKDAGQIKILKKLNAKRSDAIFEAFSNSPPYWMTKSGCTSGIGKVSDFKANDSNLKDEYYDKFCYYLVEVCKHIKEEHGIEFRTLEPFNEPYSMAWYANPDPEDIYIKILLWDILAYTAPAGGTQEGCHFKPAAQIKLIKELYDQLQASGLNTVISASDEPDISTAVNTIKEYVKDGNIMSKIGQINTHSYIMEELAGYEKTAVESVMGYTLGSSTDTDRQNLRNLADTHNKRLWQSETGPLNVEGSGLISNLRVAEILFNDIKIMKPSAWIDWQFMDSHADWSLVSGNLDGNNFTRGKNAYVRMQVTRFIKQGYTMIENNQKNVLTAISPDLTELVAVVLNTTNATANFELDMSAFYKPLAGKAYRTSSSYSCNSFTMPAITDKKLTYSAPRESITTFVIPLAINYEASAIFEGIGFEDEDKKGVEGLNAEVVNNPQTQNLNRSDKALYVEGDIKYTFGSYYVPSEEYRYLHVMTYTPDTNSPTSTPNEGNEFALLPTGEWTDQVFDLNDCGLIYELNLLLPTNTSAFYVDNIVINNNPNPFQPIEDSPYFSFENEAETPNYRMLSEEEAGTPEIVEINELLGINKEGKALKYTLPATSGSDIEDHTLNIPLFVPLRITEKTQYLHLMAYSSTGGIDIEVEGVSSSPTFYPNTWQEVIVDISSLKTKLVWEINVSYSGLEDADVTTLIDNIHFSDVSEKLSITPELPDDSPYMIYNRKSQLALTPDSEGSGIIQTIADEEETGMMWYFQSDGEYYSLVNAKEKKIMAYDSQPSVVQSIFYTAKDNASGFLFALNPSQNGYFVIKPQNADALAMGIADSTDDLATIALDTYLQGNSSQEFALFKMPEIDEMGINSLEAKTISYSNTTEGELTIFDLSENTGIEIFTLQGVLVYQAQVFRSEVTLALPTGIYVLKVQDGSNLCRLKILIK